ncbi:hypothetical protein [Actinomadura macra]|uniref:hypothetical protein n=1 Tax=Actinomadura macra TaxID=46164 RepID=UPI00082DEB05|nr:hypothetical protein [Actinomadura macra]
MDHGTDPAEFLTVADGHRIDRATPIAHTRPVRKNRATSRMEMHEALLNGDRLAAPYTRTTTPESPTAQEASA